MRMNLRPSARAIERAERRLADARRSDETENLSFDLADERKHRDEIEDAILHLLEPVMVFVENLRARARRRALRRCALSTEDSRSSRRNSARP